MQPSGLDCLSQTDPEITGVGKVEFGRERMSLDWQITDVVLVVDDFFAWPSSMMYFCIYFFDINNCTNL